MWDDIRGQIESGNYRQARALLEAQKDRGGCPDDVFAILDASVCEAESDREGMFDAIAAGLSYHPSNYELYYLLGSYYLPVNPDQAFLCFENALYYCEQLHPSGEDAEVIRAQMEELRKSFDIAVKNTAFVIVSYNSCYLMQKNIESIRSTCCKGTYQIVAVDNASDDGVAQWLEAQEDVILVRNGENRGFPCGCNQGARAIQGTEHEDCDIFLLNNDTRLSPNSLFWLRMALYESGRVGAVGSCTNYASNEQQLDITFALPQEYVEYGAKINVPLKHPCEERVKLTGFAMLVRKSAWEAAGGMDEQFSPGFFEDDDLSLKISRAGFRLLYCRNSFIYHAGSQSFSKRSNYKQLLADHHQLFIRKYGFDIYEYADPDRNLPAQIPHGREETFNLLQIGSGLGADLKLLRGSFPNANLVGIEYDFALREAASGAEAIFRSVEELAEAFSVPVFQVMIVRPDAYEDLSEGERGLLFRLCRKDCTVLAGENPYADFPFEKIKCIVWDLDDTFWKGTLSEGNVDPVQENIRLVKAAADCGIPSSISSKNDASQGYEMLEQFKVRPLFVFNDMNWEDKGPQIKRKVENMGFRPENVLFIDDNARNLEEAKHFCAGIMTALPDVLPCLAGYVEGLPPLDRGHRRLAQYQLLEKKVKAQGQFDSKEAFLAQSDIRVSISHDCSKEMDRIADLVARSNQLNFTKVRSSRDELLGMASNDWMDCGYVRVKDKYGDYGIVGFFCCNRQERRLVHFVFSCRILGMKVEQYVYGRLGFPELEIAPPTACALEKGVDVPWIAEEAELEDAASEAERDQDNRVRILLKGPCDMSAIAAYLTGGKVTTEFNYVNRNGVIVAGQNHSMHIRESACCSEEEIAEMLREAPFLDDGDFETLLFQNQYHVVCYSLLPDCHAGLYRNRKTGRYISFGSVNFDLTDERNMAGYIDGSIVNHAFPFTEEILREFARNWEFVGTTSGEDLLKNLEYMYYHAPGLPRFVLLLGSEMEYEGENAEFASHAERHREINALVRAFAEGKSRIRLIEMKDFIHSQADYADCINHFQREVYYHLAEALYACLHGWFGE